MVRETLSDDGLCPELIVVDNREDSQPLLAFLRTLGLPVLPKGLVFPIPGRIMIYRVSDD